MEFKEGDNVVCINCDNAVSITLHRIYTVVRSELNTDGNSVIKLYDDYGILVTRYSWRFRKATLLEKELMEIED